MGQGQPKGHDIRRWAHVNVRLLHQGQFKIVIVLVIAAIVDIILSIFYPPSIVHPSCILLFRKCRGAFDMYMYYMYTFLVLVMTS